MDSASLICENGEKNWRKFKINYAYNVIKAVILNRIKTDNEYLVAFIEKSPRKLN